MAFVGVAGAGKTTALCKRLAMDVFMRGQRPAALKVDLDDSWTVTPSVLYQDTRSHGSYGYDPRVGDLRRFELHVRIEEHASQRPGEGRAEMAARLDDDDARSAVDAWFLDGFSPARNPRMWSEDVMRQVAALSKPGTTAATFTVAPITGSKSP